MSENERFREVNLRKESQRLSSKDLAGLVVDALLRAGIIRDSDVQDAVEIAAEEIDVRKILGDY